MTSTSLCLLLCVESWSFENASTTCSYFSGLQPNESVVMTLDRDPWAGIGGYKAHSGSPRHSMHNKSGHKHKRDRFFEFFPLWLATLQANASTAATWSSPCYDYSGAVTLKTSNHSATVSFTSSALVNSNKVRHSSVAFNYRCTVRLFVLHSFLQVCRDLLLIGTPTSLIITHVNSPGAQYGAYRLLPIILFHLTIKSNVV